MAASVLLLWVGCALTTIFAIWIACFLWELFAASFEYILPGFPKKMREHKQRKALAKARAKADEHSQDFLGQG
jgi:hypothetical protein